MNLLTPKDIAKASLILVDLTRPTDKVNFETFLNGSTIDIESCAHVAGNIAMEAILKDAKVLYTESATRSFKKESFLWGAMSHLSFYMKPHISNAFKEGFFFRETDSLTQIEDVLKDLSEMVKSQKGYIKAKKAHEEELKEWRELKEKISILNFDIRAENKVIKEEYLAKRKNVRELYKVYESELKEGELKKPMEIVDVPEYKETMKIGPAPKLNYEKKARMYGDKSLLKGDTYESMNYLLKFKIYRVENSAYYYFKRRKTKISYNPEGLKEIKKFFKNGFPLMKKEEIFKEFEKAKPSGVGISGKVNVSYFPSMLNTAKVDGLVFDKTSIKKDFVELPPLSKLGAQQAASYVATGDSPLSIEIKVNEENVLVKTAPIKLSLKRTIESNGKTTQETIHKTGSTLSMFNTNQLKLDIYI